MPHANDPYKRRRIREIVGDALAPWLGAMADGDGNLDPFFVDRISVQCAMSLTLEENEAKVVALYCPVMTPEQIEALTGVPQPDDSGDRRLTQEEVGRHMRYSAPSIYLMWKSACDKLAPFVDENCVRIYDFALDEGA